MTVASLQPASRIDSRDGECRTRDRVVGTTSQGSRAHDPRSGVAVRIYADCDIAFLLLKITYWCPLLCSNVFLGKLY